ncbi:Alpha/Beta hydrolase protein [Mycena floridula]|nr:Alpha/Beta hydrolase protein [Mycena floridula]
MVTEPTMTPHPLRTLGLTSSDGTKIYADAAGDPQKPAIIFIHGCSLGALVFDAIFTDPRWLEAMYLVRYDVRGHARSIILNPESEDWRESERFAQDFDAVLKGFSLVRPFVAGWSLGAVNIPDILTFHSAEYITGVINITGVPYADPGVIHGVSTPLTLTIMGGMLGPTEPSIAEFQKATALFVDSCSDKLPYALREACLGMAMGQPRQVLAKLLTRAQDATNMLRQGKEGPLPLLVIRCKLDKVISSDGLRKFYGESGWKNIRMVELEEADHVPWVSQPDGFRDAILDWVRYTSSLALK